MACRDQRPRTFRQRAVRRRTETRHRPGAGGHSQPVGRALGRGLPQSKSRSHRLSSSIASASNRAGAEALPSSRSIRRRPWSSAQAWEAATQLDAQLQVIVGVKDTPWFTERKIVTMNEAGTAGPVPLGQSRRQAARFSRAGQARCAWPDDPRVPARQPWPRRNQARTSCARVQPRWAISSIRARSTLAHPRRPIVTATTRATARSSRRSRLGQYALYAGANDGMFHAFDEATGNETWAYIPSVLFRGGTAGGDPKTGLGALAYQDGAPAAVQAPLLRR